MDANKKTTTSQSGLDTIRARALKQKLVRLQPLSTDEDHAEPHCNWTGIKTLKNKVTDELEMPPTGEPSILAKMWSSFQELLGNK